MCFSFKRTNVMVLFKSHLTKSILGKCIYLSIPFLCTIALYVIMYLEEVLYSSDLKFTFLNDYSNSISAVLIFLIGYFLSASYPDILEESIKSIILPTEQMDEYQKIGLQKLERFLIIGNRVMNFIQIMVIFISVIPGIACMLIAKENELAFWLKEISGFGLLYYSVYLILTWYFSTVILCEAIYGCIIANKLLSITDIIIFDESNFDGIFGQKSFFDYLIMNVSFGIYYIIFIAVIMFTDLNSHILYKVDNTFYKYPLAGAFVFAITVIVLCILISPIIDCKKRWRIKKKQLLQECNNKMREEKMKKRPKKMMIEKLIEKKDNIEKLNISIMDLSFNRMPLVISIIVPIISVFLQMIDVYKAS